MKTKNYTFDTTIQNFAQRHNFYIQQSRVLKTPKTLWEFLGYKSEVEMLATVEQDLDFEFDLFGSRSLVNHHFQTDADRFIEDLGGEILFEYSKRIDQGFRGVEMTNTSLILHQDRYLLLEEEEGRATITVILKEGEDFFPFIPVKTDPDPEPEPERERVYRGKGRRK